MVLLQPGQRFAGRTVLAILGDGSSGTVYRAVDSAGLVHALKVVHPDVARDDAGRARFEREVAFAASLHHRNIVAVLGHGASPGPEGVLLWSAMEYLDGGTAARLAPHGRTRPDVTAIADVLAQAARGLDHAHAHDIVHRDVKPANVLLTQPHGAPGVRAVVTDFGIARLTDDARPLPRHGRVLGSLPYAAPEVLQAGRLSAATDVYSLACTAVELITGLPPFPRATAFAITHAHVSSPPPRISRRRRWIPAAVDPVVARGLAKDPGQRQQSCSDLALSLADALLTRS